MAVKRLHYYDQQFLVEADFTDEQKYHLDMRRRDTRLLHTFGIAEGLEVQRTANRQVTVRPGVALDRDGREVVVETDQVVDLGNLTTFPANTTVFITIAYQEIQSDPATATGAPGNTRFTETPNIQATTTPPPTDGTVVRLASFVKTAGGDVPGNPGDMFDGGVRQATSAKIAPGAIANTHLAASTITGAKVASATVTDVNLAAGAVTDAKIAAGAVTDTKIAAGAVTGAKLAAGAVSDANIATGTISEARLNAALVTKINAPAGIVSIDNVSNPGGNVDMVGTGAISVVGDNTVGVKRITISENHSTASGNVHNLTAAQLGAIGAMLSSQYDLRLRSFAQIQFTQADATGAARSVILGPAPGAPARIILAIGNCNAMMGTRQYGGGTFGFFDAATGVQRCFGFGISRTSDTDWFPRAAGVPIAGICSTSIFDGGVAPNVSETFTITATSTATGLTATLTRAPTGAPVGNFLFNISLFYMGF